MYRIRQALVRPNRSAESLEPTDLSAPAATWRPHLTPSGEILQLTRDHLSVVLAVRQTAAFVSATWPSMNDNFEGISAERVGGVVQRVGSSLAGRTRNRPR